MESGLYHCGEGNLDIMAALTLAFYWFFDVNCICR